MEAANGLDFDAVVKSLESQAAFYSSTLGAMSETDFAKQVDLFGQSSSSGSLIVNLVLSGHAAYRTQLFLYLKACGREELGTYNLWGGMDAPAA